MCAVSALIFGENGTAHRPAVYEGGPMAGPQRKTTRVRRPSPGHAQPAAMEPLEPRLLLDGTPGGDPIYPIYQALSYDFPRVLTLDVKDCTWVEVDNPLAKPLAVPTFLVPNVILSSDFLITTAPLKVVNGVGSLSIMNLLSLLPGSKYGDGSGGGWEYLHPLGIDKVIADLYFTLPFDLGIIEARQKFITGTELAKGEIEECGKVFIGEPYQVDREASAALGLKTSHLDLIEEARVGLEI